MIEIKSKLPYTSTSIFAVMSALANEVGAINLSQGFPGFDVSSSLIEQVNIAMKSGYNQYAPMPGIKLLREKISDKMQAAYGRFYDPESEITITSGGTQALFTAITTFIHRGDEVIVFEPAYDSYIPAIHLAGGIPVAIPLEAPEFKINWKMVERLISPKTKMIIINTPQNPTATIFTMDDIEELNRITTNTGILILSDEVYEHIIFDQQVHHSLACHEELANRSLLVYSFGKTFHATGWKMGYCIAPSYLMKEFRKVHQYNVFSANTPLQYAIAEYMNDSKTYRGLSTFYEGKRNYFQQLLQPSKFKILPCKGSYFQLLDYSAITNEKDTDYAIRLTKEIGVASIPVSVFYSSEQQVNLLRFCFAKENNQLEAAAQRLNEIQ